jgi:hypothetical protein
MAAIGTTVTVTVTVVLDERAFAYWDPQRQGWYAPPGTSETVIGSSSRAIRLTAPWARR